MNIIDNSNEIKLLKNKKFVYINSALLNYNSSIDIKEINNLFFVGKYKRCSKYRGVTKNGNRWQVLMMINKNKLYIGSYDSEDIAARIYDILVFKFRGIKAKTNFKYTNEQITKIHEADIDIKDKNINDIILQLP